MKKDKAIKQILKELESAMGKFPTWPTDPFHALAILSEEVGELNQAVLQLTYEPDKVVTRKLGEQAVREEAIQTAAMALRVLISLDKYEYKPSEQHVQ